MARGPSPRDEAGRHPDWQARAEPWLDPAEAEDAPTHTLVGRRTLWLLLLVAAVLVVGISVGLWVVAGRQKGEIDIPPPGAELPLVKNPGPWKMRPQGPGTEGEIVAGQGQTMFSTGDGIDPGGRIAVENLPEVPLDRPQGAAAAAPPPASGAAAAGVATGAPPTPAAPTELLPGAAAPPKAAAAPVAAAPPKAPPAAAPKPPALEPGPNQPAAAPSAGPPAGSGALLQLGAFSSPARAQAAWKTMAARFSYLSALSPIIAPTAHDGQTLYRLRVAAPDPRAARDICGRLKVAGEACAVVD